MISRSTPGVRDGVQGGLGDLEEGSQYPFPNAHRSLRTHPLKPPANAMMVGAKLTIVTKTEKGEETGCTPEYSIERAMPELISTPSFRIGFMGAEEN